MAVMEERRGFDLDRVVAEARAAVEHHERSGVEMAPPADLLEVATAAASDAGLELEVFRVQESVGMDPVWWWVAKVRGRRGFSRVRVALPTRKRTPERVRAAWREAFVTLGLLGEESGGA